MVTKLEAARVAAVSGIPAVLTCASNAGPAMMGDPVGTVFAPVKARGSSRRLWIGFAADPRGTIVVDEMCIRDRVNWDAARLEGQPRRIELAFKSGDPVLVQVTKDPIGHKGARLTSQVTLAGRFLVLVPSGGMTGVSRKLSERERSRLKLSLIPISGGRETTAGGAR